MTFICEARARSQSWNPNFSPTDESRTGRPPADQDRTYAFLSPSGDRDQRESECGAMPLLPILLLILVDQARAADN